MFPSKLLLCIDDPKTFGTYRQEIGWLARQLRCRLVLFHGMWLALEKGVAPGSTQAKEIEAIEKLARDPALHTIEVETVVVDPVTNLETAILDAAIEFGADCVVVPTHARTGLGRLIFGSVAERVLRSCRVPTLTFDLEQVPRKIDQAAFDHIVVPVDFSAISEQALPYALSLADRLSCPVTLFHVFEDEALAAYSIDGMAFGLADYRDSVMKEANKKLEAMRKRHAGSTGAKIETLAVSGRLTDRLHTLAGKTKNPMIVMATAGHDSIGDSLLGSRAERIVRTAACTVLALPKSFLSAGDEAAAEA